MKINYDSNNEYLEEIQKNFLEIYKLNLNMNKLSQLIDIDDDINKIEIKFKKLYGL